MASSQHLADAKSSGKAPEKSNFASTCNLLSQYLKERGNLKDLSRSINGKLEAIGKSETSHITIDASTKNLLNSLQDLNKPPPQETTPMDTLPRFARMVSPSNSEDCTNKASSSKEATVESKSAQMTIFYDGQVWVFNDFPADKALEVMHLATRGNPNSANANLSPPSAEKTNPVAAVTSSTIPPPNPASTTGKGKAREQSEANNSDLPIARRSSLHRFLEKRKERSTARGPYQVGHEAPGSSSKNDEQQLELRL